MFKRESANFLMIITASRRGLSLVEILVALTLLALGATFIAGRVFDSLDEGKVQAAKIQIGALSDRLGEYRRHCGQYPTTEQGLEALVTKPSTGRECKRYRDGGYLKEGTDIPLDPWDNEYIYESDGRIVDIISLGADGLEGGDEIDADISLRNKRSDR